MIVIIYIVFLSLFQQVFAQSSEDLVPDVSTTDLTILFSVSIAVVVGLVIYLLRDSILRKKTSYDAKEFASKKDHDYEKYHSEWTSDDTDFGRPKDVRHREFKKALQDETLPDCYAILGVQKSATPIEIKNRYRALVKKLHPDKSKDPSTKEKMSEINRAYEILSDMELRQSYDKYYDALG
ncbi:MAG: J domain-containing protein [Thaumarchaeota archaeon]|nr:J domain-containing protein [Nitrososphaerota archaeon]